MSDELEALFDAGEQPPTKTRPGRWPWVLSICGVLLAAVIGLAAAAVALYGQALQVRDDLTAARSELSGVPDTVRAGDRPAFDAAAEAALERLDAAEQTVGGPLWQVASWIPGVGTNIVAVREVTQAAHLLARDALPVSFDVLAAVQPERIRFAGGGFDLAPLRDALLAAPEIDESFAAAQAHLDRIDREGLVPQVENAIGGVADLIADTGPLVHTATEVLPEVLKMLGEDGPRSYLVLFQNNAEIRATGGNPAASILVTVDAGRVHLAGQDSSATFSDSGLYGKQFLDLPADTLSLYDDEFARFPQNYTKTADFPTTARLFHALLAERGDAIDGVISLDPVVLAAILSVTGPVTVADGTELTAQNAVSVLLNETYFRFPGDQAPADAFFAATSAAVFERLALGTWDPLAMVQVLTRAAEQQRLYAWFTRDQEEQVATRLGIDGALAADNERTTELGVFVNDAGVSKLEYYLDTTITVTCDADARTVTTSLTLTNRVDRADLPHYVGSLRAPRYGASADSMLLDVIAIAPPGADIDSLTPAGGDIPDLTRSGVEVGRVAQSITVVVERGATETITFVSTLPDGELGPLTVRTSPTTGQTPITIDAGCAALAGAAG